MDKSVVSPFFFLTHGVQCHVNGDE